MTELRQPQAATLAGAMYLVQMTTAIAGYSARASLGVPGDATATARNIIGAESLYRLSIVADLITVCAVLVLMWALYVLLRPVNRDVALLAVLFRIVENTVIAVMAVGLLTSLALLRPADYLAGFEPGQLHALGRLVRGGHGAGFGVGFVFCGFGSALFASLLFRSRYVPRLLAAWGIAASLALAVCALATMVFPEAATQLQIVSFAPMFVYEVGLGAWLLIRGVSVPKGV